MKIALVNPPPLHRIERDDLPFYPHLGLGYLASSLEQNGFEEILIIDAKLERKNLDNVLYDLKAFNPDVLGITAMTHEIIQASQLAEQVREIFPPITIVVGGVHVSILPQETLEEFPAFDYGLRNEGEKSFPLLMKALSEKGELETVPNLAYRTDNSIHLTTQADWLNDLDSIPFPAWNRFPKAREYPILTSRGCPFQCNFCHPYGQKVRYRSPENVIEELDWVVSEFKPDIINVYDETFGIDQERTFKLLDLMIKHAIPQRTRWWAYTRVNVATDDLLRKMKDAGAFMIGFGIETGNEEILKKSKKNIKLKRAEELVSIAKKIGLKTQTYFILGHPYETLETINDTIDFAIKLNGDLTCFGIMVPYPGTKIYEMAKNGEGGYRLIAKTWNDYNKQIGNALELVSIPRKKIERLQMFAYLKVFLKNHRYWDLVKFCWGYRRQAMGFILKHFLNKW